MNFTVNVVSSAAPGQNMFVVGLRPILFPGCQIPMFFVTSRLRGGSHTHTQKVKGSVTVVTALTPPMTNHLGMKAALGCGHHFEPGGIPPQGNDRKCGKCQPVF